MRRLRTKLLEVAPSRPAANAALVSALVIISTSVVFVGVAVVAPLLAGDPPSQLSPEELRTGEIGGSPLAAPRLKTGLDRPGVSPDPVETHAFTPDPTMAITPSIDDAVATAKPARLVPLMTVDRRTARTGDRVTYEVLVSNAGGRSYTGAFTVNTHTPLGTTRCDGDVCLTPGDYDGESTDPNDPHANPPSTTQSITIAPGGTAVLFKMEVMVASLSGTVLHNHAHVDGVGHGDGSGTVKPGVVGVTALELPREAVAPDVVVVG